jgi:esterase FrsA
MSENLSKELFTPKFHVAETSTLIPNSSTKKYLKAGDDIMDGEERKGWYRLLKFLLWAWQGMDIIECYDVLAHISASDNERSDNELLDSVTGFRSGNWSYEWTQKAMFYQKQGAEFSASGQREKAKQAYYQASQYYSVASYPHLKGDELSMQAQVLAHNNYRESFKYNDHYQLKEINIPFQGKDVKCYLHLPHTEAILPVVILSSGLDSLQCDYYSLFENELAPAGIAMLTVDLPGVGYSSHVKLEQNASNLLQDIIHHLDKVPWVDQARIALMGMRFGGNVATRLAFLEPKKVKTVVCVGAAVGSVFDKLDNFKKIPPMLLDCIASRMQASNSRPEYLFQSCVPFSLIKQGLLAKQRINTPLLSIGHQNDIMCNKYDLQLIANASREGKLHIIDKPPIFESYLNCLSASAKWLTRHLAE